MQLGKCIFGSFKKSHSHQRKCKFLPSCICVQFSFWYFLYKFWCMALIHVNFSSVLANKHKNQFFFYNQYSAVNRSDGCRNNPTILLSFGTGSQNHVDQLKPSAEVRHELDGYSRFICTKLDLRQTIKPW